MPRAWAVHASADLPCHYRLAEVLEEDPDHQPGGGAAGPGAGVGGAPEVRAAGMAPGGPGQPRRFRLTAICALEPEVIEAPVIVVPGLSHVLKHDSSESDKRGPAARGDLRLAFHHPGALESVGTGSPEELAPVPSPSTDPGGEDTEPRGVQAEGDAEPTANSRAVQLAVPRAGPDSEGPGRSGRPGAAPERTLPCCDHHGDDNGVGLPPAQGLDTALPPVQAPSPPQAGTAGPADSLPFKVRATPAVAGSCADALGHPCLSAAASEWRQHAKREGQQARGAGSSQPEFN
jgi:hypothetical protein